MTGPLLLAVGASFLAGSFGYVLFQFWLKPLLKYRRAKHRVLKTLDRLDFREVDGTSGSTGPIDTKARRENIRQLAAALSACYSEELPDWFQLLLERRGESPLEAAAFLMKLANTRDSGHAARQAQNIRKSLKA